MAPRSECKNSVVVAELGAATLAFRVIRSNSRSARGASVHQQRAHLHTKRRVPAEFDETGGDRRLDRVQIGAALGELHGERVSADEPTRGITRRRRLGVARQPEYFRVGESGGNGHRVQHRTIVHCEGDMHELRRLFRKERRHAFVHDTRVWIRVERVLAC